MDKLHTIIRTYLLDIIAEVAGISSNYENIITNGVDCIYLSPKGCDVSPIGIAVYLDRIYGYNSLDIIIFTAWSYDEVYRGNLADPNIKKPIIDHIIMAVADFKRVYPAYDNIADEIKSTINLPIYNL